MWRYPKSRNRGNRGRSAKIGLACSRGGQSFFILPLLARILSPDMIAAESPKVLAYKSDDTLYTTPRRSGVLLPEQIIPQRANQNSSCQTARGTRPQAASRVSNSLRSVGSYISTIDSLSESDQYYQMD